MPILSLLVTLIVFGFVLYVVKLLPIDATVKQIINAGAVVFLVVYLLYLLVPGFERVGPLR